ncbi:hypothetical protein ColLi_09569 [Colletotrichum liriopes]|uniref:Uncharacterized protein n=1 Tax=Colletotrichum liriopes TaxID=708192 RepID=A0AA37GT13_9PEZI|nr:hypothetical protein ColLi_09569 [Colletotrichum liriopes]
MSEQASSLKQCPISHCRRQPESDADVRGHIIDFHKRDPERMPCGRYTIRNYYYRQKHQANCDNCRPRSPEAQAPIPSIEDDVYTDISTPEPDPREGEPTKDSQATLVLVNGGNNGLIYVAVGGCPSS